MDQAAGIEQEVADLIISTLNLDEVGVTEIDPDAPLFREGLGLDSIDALELALAISGRYGFQIKSDDSETLSIFSSLRSLAEHIQRNRIR
ncbi:phosphopantetheine-binding protein [Acidihalobacter prosperus]|uniref:Acyl carrier protein n=1 Tax=Acidihalobacter prosperus TaxID=160660 RepID=A0A1A6C4D0_9GAMM|nr:phosphopantetheine-binding protein [Acidihalobacter prosperus]OBS09409.1 acyl carrier protein [Acidihalobacter prosperus]